MTVRVGVCKWVCVPVNVFCSRACQRLAGGDFGGGRHWAGGIWVGRRDRIRGARACWTLANHGRCFRAGSRGCRARAGPPQGSRVAPQQPWPGRRASKRASRDDREGRCARPAGSPPHDAHHDDARRGTSTGPPPRGRLYHGVTCRSPVVGRAWRFHPRTRRYSAAAPSAQAASMAEGAAADARAPCLTAATTRPWTLPWPPATATAERPCRRATRRGDSTGRDGGLKVRDGDARVPLGMRVKNADGQQSG